LNHVVPDPISVAAAGETGWHTEAYAALGVPWHVEHDLAWRVGASHPFLLAAITVSPDVTAARVLKAAAEAEGSVVVCDSHDRLDLSYDGYRGAPTDPWMLRPPAPVDPAVAPMVDGVTIRRAGSPDDVEAFERTAFLANDDLAHWVPGALHPRDTTLRRTNLHLLLAEVDGVPIGTALASVNPTGVTVSGVAVVPSLRRRGIGAALVRVAVEVAPDRPASLSASDLGLGTYRRLGFIELARPRHWTRIP
jgi:GNAT superfamily N-acetyltransferase